MNQIKASNTSFSPGIVNGINMALLIMSLVVTFLIVSCAKNEKQALIVEGSYQNELAELTKKYEKGDTVALKAIVRMMQDCPDRSTCKEMANSLYIIAGRYSNEEFFTLSIDLYSAGRIAAEKSEDEQMRISYYVELAFNYQKIAKSDSLNHYMRLAEAFPPEFFPKLARSQFLLTKAFVADAHNRYFEAIDYYLQAHSLVKGQQSVNEAVILENIGSLYTALKYYNRSLSYFQKSMPTYELAKDTARLMRLYSNMGIAYMHLDSLDLASDMHIRSLNMAEKHSFAYARGLANYGNVLRRQGKYEQARKAFDTSTIICQKSGISFGVLINKINLSEVYLDTRNPSEALLLLEEIKDSPLLTDKNIQIEVAQNFMRAYEQMNDIQRAFEYQKKVNALKNALVESGEERLALEWEEKVLRQNVEREMGELRHALNRSRQQQTLIVLACLLTLFILLLIVRIFYLRKQKQQLHSQLLEEEGENLRLLLELKERTLTSQAIHLQSIGGFTDAVTGKLLQLRNKLKGVHADELTGIIKDFENGIPAELWDDFRLRFEKANEDFHQSLLNIAPNLSPVEIKIASFLRLNLSSKEISRLTNRTVGTIINTRTSLRKKLHLQEEDNLVSFLMSL